MSALEWPKGDADVVLLHNARCSKSRATRALLEEHGIEFVTHDYIADPLDRAELEELGARLGLEPRDWVRPGELPAGVDLGDGARLIELVAAEPRALQRPIVVRGARAQVGRPPEQVLELFAGS